MDKFEQLIDVLRVELKGGFGLLSEKIDQTNSRLDQTNSRLDQTNSRLDQTNNRLDIFETSMGTRLDGIGTYLKSINGTLHDHSDDIFELKRRINKIEQRDNPPQSDP